MSFLLDTSVVSELVKKVPHEEVVSWLSRQDEESLYLSVLTLGELEKGSRNYVLQRAGIGCGRGSRAILQRGSRIAYCLLMFPWQHAGAS